MVRRVTGGPQGRIEHGLAAGLVARFRDLDRTFHFRDGPCYWCDTITELRAGRPVVLDGGMLHLRIPCEALGCDGVRHWETRDDEARFVVTGDVWERLPGDVEAERSRWGRSAPTGGCRAPALDVRSACDGCGG